MSNRSLIALVGALIVALAAPPTSAVEPDEPNLEEIERQLETAENKLQAAQRESRDVRGELAVAQDRRQALTAEVRDLDVELHLAQAELAALEALLDQARAELEQSTQALRRARRDLLDQRAQLNERAAAAYIVGPSGYLDIVLGSRDLAEIADRAGYVEHVLAVDSDLLEGIRVTRGLVADHRERISAVEQHVDRRFEAVQERAARIAAMKAEQESLLEQLDLEIEFTVGTLEDLAAAREEYEAQVAALQAESARIQGFIEGWGSTGSGQYGGQLYWPTSGPIVSGFGYRTHPLYGTTRFHSGVDIEGACGQPISAAEVGTVLSAGYNGGYGNATVIDHGEGLSTLYAHQTSIGVSAGEPVSRGEQIGTVGTTGLSTGCHLHFEVRVNGQPVDPVPYLT